MVLCYCRKHYWLMQRYTALTCVTISNKIYLLMTMSLQLLTQKSALNFFLSECHYKRKWLCYCSQPHTRPELNYYITTNSRIDLSIISRYPSRREQQQKVQLWITGQQQWSMRPLGIAVRVQLITIPIDWCIMYQYWVDNKPITNCCLTMKTTSLHYLQRSSYYTAKG